jgi:Ca2+:H+ antiporter
MIRAWSLVAVPAALVLERLGNAPVAAFALSLLGIFTLVGIMGRATERLSAKLGPTTGGLLNASLVNLPEVIIGTVALANGYPAVVKASLTGAILANLLLGLGVALVAGGLRHGDLRFDSGRLRISSSMLMLCAFCFIVPAVFNLGTPEGTRDLSVEMSLVLVAIYVLNVVVTVVVRGPATGLVVEEEIVDEHPREPVWRSVAVLAATAAGLGIVSETMSKALEPTAAALGLTQTFSGLVLLGAVGSLGEILSGARFALQGRSSLLLSATVGSTIQTVLLVAPLLVFAGQVLGQPMDLAFTSFEVVAIVLATVITRELIQDGRANWFEGVLLLAAYAILAIGFFHLPA